MSNQREKYEVISRLQKLGFDYETANQLRRISMQLHSWFERECGTDNGCIERDEDTGKAFWLNSHSMNRYPIADREAGAKKRLAKIMAAYRRRLVAYIQGDCRGASLYILRKSDIRKGESIDSIYNRGTAVY